MIVTAFAQGDRRTLKDLLPRKRSTRVSSGRSPIARAGAEKVETTFVSIDKAEITGAEVQGKTRRSACASSRSSSPRPATAAAPSSMGARTRSSTLRMSGPSSGPWGAATRTGARRDRSGAMTVRGGVCGAPPGAAARDRPPFHRGRAAVARLEPSPFRDLAGWAEDDHRRGLSRSSEAAAHRRGGSRPVRPGSSPG